MDEQPLASSSQKSPHAGSYRKSLRSLMANISTTGSTEKSEKKKPFFYPDPTLLERRTKLLKRQAERLGLESLADDQKTPDPDRRRTLTFASTTTWGLYSKPPSESPPSPPSSLDDESEEDESEDDKVSPHHEESPFWNYLNPSPRSPGGILKEAVSRLFRGAVEPQAPALAQPHAVELAPAEPVANLPDAVELAPAEPVANLPDAVELAPATGEALVVDPLSTFLSAKAKLEANLVGLDNVIAWGLTTDDAVAAGTAACRASSDLLEEAILAIVRARKV